MGRRRRSTGTLGTATSLLFDSSTLTIDGLVGTTSTDVARVYDQLNQLLPATGTITYSSSDPTVATVSSTTGLITSVGNGTATITASWFAP